MTRNRELRRLISTVLDKALLFAIMRRYPGGIMVGMTLQGAPMIVGQRRGRVLIRDCVFVGFAPARRRDVSEAQP